MNDERVVVEMKYRPQVLGVNGWVDGTLFGRKRDAERDHDFLAELWSLPTRIIEVHVKAEKEQK